MDLHEVAWPFSIVLHLGLCVNLIWKKVGFADLTKSTPHQIRPTSQTEVWTTPNVILLLSPSMFLGYWYWLMVLPVLGMIFAYIHSWFSPLSSWSCDWFATARIDAGQPEHGVSVSQTVLQLLRRSKASASAVSDSQWRPVLPSSSCEEWRLGSWLPGFKISKKPRQSSPQSSLNQTHPLYFFEDCLTF